MTEEKPCRHEYVRIYQRKLKGLERRLVATRAYLPIGFKQADFGHLSEGSYCFCAKCRARLFPRRTQAEKLAARVATAQGKATQQALAEELALELAVGVAPNTEQVEADSDIVTSDIHVEELELESVDVQDIEAEGVKLADDQEVSASEEEDL